MITLTTGLLVLLIACLFAVCVFEFINGFHDTANAVATVIYTGTLKPVHAVIWSGVWNFIGLMTGGIAVAMGISSLLPTEILIQQDIHQNVAMVLAALTAAIIWNLGTWYMGIPCSSSHTLIGSLLGVGMVFSMLPENTAGVGVNWQKAKDIGMSLLVSPLFGFSLAIILMFILRSVIESKEIFKEPVEGSKPPLWIRGLLIFTCTAVSWAHGSNDGQKGLGLALLILMAFLPLQYALAPDFNPTRASDAIQTIEQTLVRAGAGNIAENEMNKTVETIASLKAEINAFRPDDAKQKFAIRKRIQLMYKKIDVLLKEPAIFENANDKKIISRNLKELKGYTEWSPIWLKFMIALSLGIGTMIGWKRIVITIGEKIGKRHMTYAEGASAELVAASTIYVSTQFGLPVSTTHVLSSGVAGAMVASKGVKNLQKGTVKNMVTAWVLTLPVTILLSAILFMVFRFIVQMVV